MSKLRTPRSSVLLSAAVLILSACHAKPKVDLKAANQDTFTRGMVAYLAARGELCLGKEFPIDVTEREDQLRSRNAVQMPALEHLGLVSSSQTVGQITTEDGPLAVPVTRFELTDSGRQYYRTRPSAAEGDKTHSDLCVAQLSLDKVVSWEMPSGKDGTSATVSYTYHVQAAPWTSVPEVKAVFPAVDRVVTGAGNALLKEGFTLTNDGWVANELLPPATAKLAQNGAR
jgi:hypothetical protein